MAAPAGELALTRAALVAVPARIQHRLSVSIFVLRPTVCVRARRHARAHTHSTRVHANTRAPHKRIKPREDDVMGHRASNKLNEALHIMRAHSLEVFALIDTHTHR